MRPRGGRRPWASAGGRARRAAGSAPAREGGGAAVRAHGWREQMRACTAGLPHHRRESQALPPSCQPASACSGASCTGRLPRRTSAPRMQRLCRRAAAAPVPATSAAAAATAIPCGAPTVAALLRSTPSHRPPCAPCSPCCCPSRPPAAACPPPLSAAAPPASPASPCGRSPACPAAVSGHSQPSSPSGTCHSRMPSPVPWRPGGGSDSPSWRAASDSAAAPRPRPEKCARHAASGSCCAGTLAPAPPRSCCGAPPPPPASPPGGRVAYAMQCGTASGSASLASPRYRVSSPACDEYLLSHLHVLLVALRDAKPRPPPLIATAHRVACAAPRTGCKDGERAAVGTDELSGAQAADIAATLVIGHCGTAFVECRRA